MIGLRANFHLPLGERGTFANYDRLRTYRVRERKKSCSSNKGPIDFSPK